MPPIIAVMHPAPDFRSVPPGWYPDPSGAPVQRFWDGNAWTAQTAGGHPAAVPPRAARPPWIPWIIAGVAVVLALAILLVTWINRPSRMGHPGQPGQTARPVAMSVQPGDLDGSNPTFRGSLAS